MNAGHQLNLLGNFELSDMRAFKRAFKLCLDSNGSSAEHKIVRK